MMMTVGKRTASAVTMIAVTMIAVPAGAQLRTIDPNQAPAAASGNPGTPARVSGYDVGDQPAERAAYPTESFGPRGTGVPSPDKRQPGETGDARADAAAVAANDTYAEKDVLDAAEGVFGKGASGLAKLIEDVFRKQGRPTGYIAGREAGGAIIAGVRYGSGTLFHRIEGRRPIYWTGPSVGFDLGANGAKTFVLIYNLYDTQDLYRRFPAAEGNVYVVGGFTASYLRWGKIVVIPIRLGVGWRLGANIGYMRFSEKSRWSPF